MCSSIRIVIEGYVLGTILGPGIWSPGVLTLTEGVSGGFLVGGSRDNERMNKKMLNVCKV